MHPTIINDKSRFVVITYWWGRGNLNQNTARPCKSDEYQENDGKTVRPITFEAMIKRWENSCINNKCNYMAVEYPEFARKGQYQNAINQKPSFIKEALKACYPRAVVYIDGDMLIKRYPRLFDIQNIDYMARHWQIDAGVQGRQSVGKTEKCYDPYVFETSGGTMYFNNTPKSQELLHMWNEKSKIHRGKADDRIISLYFNMKKMLLSMAIIFLPTEYLWLSMSYDKGFGPKAWKRSHVYITHPECLTGEDIASDQGAATNRYPKNYGRIVDDHIDCARQKTILYEYIYFPNKQYRTTMKHYMDWLQNTKHVTVVPYDKKYGKYTKNSETNKKLMSSIKLNKSDHKMVYVTVDENLNKPNIHVIKNKRNVLPIILKYLTSGKNVMYVPNDYSKKQMNAISKRVEKYPVDFVARNDNTDDEFYTDRYQLEMDVDYPMYFNHANATLQHLLIMCRQLKTIDTVFNTCADFICRIRCMWI